MGKRAFALDSSAVAGSSVFRRIALELVSYWWRIHVCRRTGERYAACCIHEINRWGGGSVMVWAGVSYWYKTALHFYDRSLNAQRYRDNMLTPLVAPMFQTHRDLRVYQQDNARPHMARISVDFLHNANIRVMPGPALSPDLAPIEHVWDELGRRVYSRPNKPTTVDGLRRALTGEWNNMPQTVIQNIILSMRRRCTACINARGGHTRYWLFDLRVPMLKLLWNDIISNCATQCDMNFFYG
jgi:hypothetical protein